MLTRLVNSGINYNTVSLFVCLIYVQKDFKDLSLSLVRIENTIYCTFPKAVPLVVVNCEANVDL